MSPDRDRPLYRGMDRSALDREYDARATVDDIAPFLSEYADLSALARNSLEVRTALVYGQSADETLDFFPAGSSAPLFVFFHGGYWRLLSKDESAFMAVPLVAAGISVAAVNYSLAPAASLDTIVAQARRAIVWLAAHADELGIEPERIFVGGSSAGAHLAAMTMIRVPGNPGGRSQEQVAGALLASGLYDLEPLRHCHPNEWLQLDESAAMRNSPLHHIESGKLPLVVTWAGSETGEFRRQSRQFASLCQRKGYAVDAFEVPDRNHFNIITDLADPQRRLFQALLSMIHDTAA